MRNGKVLSGRLFLGLVLVVVVAGLVSTVLGEGQRIGRRDSPTYLAAADQLVLGNGYQTPFGDRAKPIDFESAVSPVVDFPPGFSGLLAVGLLFGLAGSTSGLIVTVGSVSAIALLFYWYAVRRTGSVWLGALVGVIAAGLTLRVSTVLISEPLFGLLTAVALMSAEFFFRTRSSSSYVIAAVAAILATSVRTMGLAIVATVAIVGWVASSSSLNKVVRASGVLLGGIGTFWILVGGGSRVVAWHPPDATSLKVAMNAVASILVPPISTPTVRFILLVGVLGAVGMIAFRPLRRGSLRSGRSGAWIGLLCAGIQMAILLLTRAFVDAQTDPSYRLIYPMVIALLVSSVVWLGSGEERAVPEVRVVISILAVMALVSAAGYGWEDARALRATNGLEFAATSFLESPGVKLAVSEPEGSVYSNIPDGLWVAGLDGARALPTTYDPLSLSPSINLDMELARLEEEILNGSSIYIDRRWNFDYLVDEEALLSFAPCVAHEDADSLMLVSRRHRLCRSS